MKPHRLLLPLLLGAALALLFTACNRGEKSAAAANQGSTCGGKPTLALVVKTLNNPFLIEMQKGAEEAAKKLGVTPVVQAADREIDVERQMQIIENLIERKVSALCITPSGSREIVPVIVKSNKAGIPVLIVDTRADGNTNGP
jgi:ribose transport system substrate-binding protein